MLKDLSHDELWNAYRDAWFALIAAKGKYEEPGKAPHPIVLEKTKALSEVSAEIYRRRPKLSIVHPAILDI